MANIIEQIRKELRANSSEEVRQSSLRFFKEDIKVYGYKTALVQQIAKEYFKLINDLSKPAIFDLCEQLWQSGYMEESFIACNWSQALNKKFEQSDFKVFEKWVSNYISNWASCDTFCNHTVGEFIQQFPDFLNELKKWAKSENRWVRRAAAVSLIVPARKGLFLDDIFEIADILLIDSDDLVQKGYGWMLKVASQAHQKDVFEFVMNNKNEMPRTALRYAIEKMPDELKRRAMDR